MKITIGLIVNPVAGMGGRVGLKGTDGEMYKKALKLGAQPVTPQRTKTLLSHIKNKNKITLIVAPGKMGQEYVKKFDIPCTVVGEIGRMVSAEDTKKISREMVNNGIELLIFVGGDGTARDIYDAVDSKVSVVGVPAGVKIFSSVFGASARAAAEMVDAFVEGTDVTAREVLDIDEEAFREDRLASRLYGYLMVPNVQRFLQSGKAASSTGRSFVDSKEQIAAYIVEQLDQKTLYLLGPGTTLKAIADKMKLQKTLLGIDAVFAGKLEKKDVNEKDILNLLEKYQKRKIIITPIGGNGFIFGRGSKQFSPEVIKQVGRENIMVVGTKDKINKLECLRVDTGDYKVDKLLVGYIEIIVGYKEGMMVKVQC